MRAEEQAAKVTMAAAEGGGKGARQGQAARGEGARQGGDGSRVARSIHLDASEGVASKDIACHSRHPRCHDAVNSDAKFGGDLDRAA